MRFYGWLGVILIRALPAPGDWETVMAQGRALFRQGYYQEAMETLRQAVMISEGFDSLDLRKTIAVGELAVAVQAIGQLIEAEKLFLQALAVCERLPDPAAECLSPVLGGLASVYIDRRQFAKAEPLLRRAVALLGADGDLFVAARLHLYLGASLYYRKRPEEAEAQLRRSLELTERAGKLSPRQPSPERSPSAPSARSTSSPRRRCSNAPPCCAAPGAPAKPASSKSAPARPSPATTATTSSTTPSTSAPSAPSATVAQALLLAAPPLVGAHVAALFACATSVILGIMSGQISLSRRAVLASLGAPAVAAELRAARERGAEEYPEDVAGYLKNLYDRRNQPLAFREDYRGGFQKWREKALIELHLRLGMGKIAASASHHRPLVELGEPVERGGYTQQKGIIETEPQVRIPFWFLKPKVRGPWPLGIFPHGHSETGHDTSAGVFATEAQKKRALAEDRDVAVQAVKLGIAAIAPAVRGLSALRVPDFHERHGGRECRSNAIHCLLAGRTTMGERVWDISRFLDWAVKLPEIDPSRIVCMGNSGGGMVTIFAAACNHRITVAVPSCSFSPTVSSAGYVYHCDCNVVPGIMELGGLPHVAGLIAPRFLLTVNGRKDRLHSVAAVESAAAEVRKIYRASGHPGHYEHRWGPEGHRFYKDLMWPFIQKAFSQPRG